MYITNTAACGSDGNWETYSTTKNNWTLGQTNATATVYVKFRDAVGNESSCINDTITHVISYTVGGTVSGLLSGRAVVLRNNAGDDLTVSANGSFTFATSVANNAAYAVTVLTQPTDQSCTVTSGTGTVTANVNTVSVACALSCTGLAGGTWVRVPGDSTYGTSDFCVMKYEAKNVSSTATSQASGAPWVSIAQTAAQTACSNLGANFQLITNNQWMSLASNIASTASNWSGGSVGSGTINRGHSDTDPNSACAASSDDSFGYVETNCTPRNSGDWTQKRTHTLSTGAVIWDLAGNVNDWTSYVIANNSAKPYVTADGAPTALGRELSTINNSFTAMTLKELRPINAEKSFWSDSWNSTEGLGRYFAGSNGTGGSLWRGGTWNQGAGVGVFFASLVGEWASANAFLGFRCTKVASP
jgi:hypothetical protein